MSSSSFRINFCCSSTFEVSSAIYFSASSRRLDFSDILTFKRCKKKNLQDSYSREDNKYVYMTNTDCPPKSQTIFQHINQVPTFNCVSSCSILRFLSRSKASSLLISSPLVASSQSSASIELYPTAYWKKNRNFNKHGDRKSKIVRIIWRNNKMYLKHISVITNKMMWANLV